jgi:hypothetical protein
MNGTPEQLADLRWMQSRIQSLSREIDFAIGTRQTLIEAYDQLAAEVGLSPTPANVRPVMSRAEIESAVLPWRAAQQVMKETGDRTGEKLAEGYVGALEMVLRGDIPRRGR